MHPLSPPRCPRCDLALHTTVRQGVEVDICPQCLGVWLDRGEIDKIVNRLAVGDPDGFPYVVDTSLEDLLEGTR